MKKLLSLAFLLVCTLTMMQAQSTEGKKACSKACAKTCEAKKTASATTEATMTQVASAYMEADEAAAADDSIEKRVCATSGKTSYFQKSVCEKSGSVSWNEVEYNNEAKAFTVSMSDGSALGDVDTKVGSASKEKACCSKTTKVASASKEKACCKGAAKSCSKDAKKESSN